VAGEGLSQAKNHWKHWVVYSTATFLSIFVFAEFALSVSFISILAPSTFMFFLTPVGFFLGEALVSFFASVLVFLGLFTVLRLKVYVKTEESLRFNRSDSYLLLPFYLVPLVSLGVYISLIPLELSNILTYLVFLILFESFIEHVQVSDYRLKVPKALKKVTPTKSESSTGPEKIQGTLAELKNLTEIREKGESGEAETKRELKVSDEDFEQMIKDLYEIVGEKEEVEEETLDKKRSVEELTRIQGVGKKRAVKLYESGLETPEDIVDKGLGSLAGIEQIGIKTAKKILDNAKELEKDKSKKKKDKDELEAELEELEELLLED